MSIESFIQLSEDGGGQDYSTKMVCDIKQNETTGEGQGFTT